MTAREYYGKYRGKRATHVFNKYLTGKICGYFTTNTDLPGVIIALDGKCRGWNADENDISYFHIDQESIYGYWGTYLSEIKVDNSFKFGK